MRSALADKQFSLADYQKYAKAPSAVKSTYYMETTGLAATDDFQPVTIRQHHVRMTSTRDDFPIALDGDAFAGVAECLDEFGDAERAGELADLAVDRDFHGARF